MPRARIGDLGSQHVANAAPEHEVVIPFTAKDGTGRLSERRIHFRPPLASRAMKESRDEKCVIIGSEFHTWPGASNPLDMPLRCR